MIRYADDLVICCQTYKDAERIRRALSLRLEKYKLKMNEDKTKLVSFSRRKQKQSEDQGTFDFLGLTFYMGKSRKGRYIVKVKTSGTRLRAKLKKVNVWARSIRNKLPLKQLMKVASSKLRGHIQYYGVSHNSAKISSFIQGVKRILFRWLNRRSQRKSFSSWKEFQKFLDSIEFPKAKRYHSLF